MRVVGSGQRVQQHSPSLLRCISFRSFPNPLLYIPSTFLDLCTYPSGSTNPSCTNRTNLPLHDFTYTPMHSKMDCIVLFLCLDISHLSTIRKNDRTRGTSAIQFDYWLQAIKDDCALFLPRILSADFSLAHHYSFALAFPSFPSLKLVLARDS